MAKLLGGVFGHSLALVSDAIHSLVDAAISGGLLAALHVAERPADPEHPYGHGRAEALAGTAVALLLLALAGGIAWRAISASMPDSTAGDLYPPHRGMRRPLPGGPRTGIRSGSPGGPGRGR